MLRTVLWIAAACAAVLVALSVSRTLDFDKPPPKPAPPAEQAKPDEKVAAKPTEPAAPAQPKPPPSPEELQIQEDAAATGMTTRVEQPQK